MPQNIVICECFARDGLQHEPRFVPTSTKVELIDAFAATGFSRIEVTSYSSLRRVPALADASEVLERIARPAGVAFKATCPNPRAVERAVADWEAGHGADELSFLVSASESHNLRNLATTRDEQWDRVRDMARIAGGRFRLVGVVSVAFGCPIEGPVPEHVVADDVRRFEEVGVELVTLGDTVGMATPRSVDALFTGLQNSTGLTLVSHFHDTRGRGLANCIAALNAGCTHFDSSFGGVGGHPSDIEYGAGRTGNVSTEDLVDLLEAMGVSTSLDQDALMHASRLCEAALGRQLESRVARADARLTQEMVREVG